MRIGSLCVSDVSPCYGRLRIPRPVWDRLLVYIGRSKSCCLSKMNSPLERPVGFSIRRTAGLQLVGLLPAMAAWRLELGQLLD